MAARPAERWCPPDEEKELGFALVCTAYWSCSTHTVHRSDLDGGRASPQRTLSIGQTTLNSDARSKSPGVRFLWSTVSVELIRIWTGRIAYPTSANACASRLQQMNRVAFFAIVYGSERKRVGSRCRNRFRPSTQACARSYSPPIRFTTQSASRRRSTSFKPMGRSTRTCSACSSESRIDLTPAATSASTMHSGSGPSSSGPTYIDTCDQVDCVMRLTSAATRVLPSLSRTSPRSSIAASDCGGGCYRTRVFDRLGEVEHQLANQAGAHAGKQRHCPCDPG